MAVPRWLGLDVHNHVEPASGPPTLGGIPKRRRRMQRTPTYGW
jgi:hypothetical protein